MNQSSKLYLLSSKEFQLPAIVLPDGQVKYKAAPNIPLISWPNGLVCWPVTLYINNKYKSGLSSLNSGGTLLTYAKNISPFIRFCHDEMISFSSMDDNRFANFMEKINDQMTVDGKGALIHSRKSNQVINIGRRVLDFLFWYQDFFLSQKLIGEAHENCNITVYKKEHQVQGRSMVYWTHTSFPTRNSEEIRQPVNTDDLEKLFISNINSDNTRYVIRRRAAMLHLARATGARRIEMSKLSVQSIIQAYEVGILNITSAKSRNREKIRSIPVLKSTLEPVISFIKGARTNIIRNTIGINNDCGFLFVSHNGKKLSENTLTNEMHDLAVLSNLESRVCLHMFRHRYFTDMAYNFLLGIREFAERRELTAPSEQIVLHQMRSLSQHENNHTLMRYIHMAYKEAKAWDIGQSIWNLSKIHESMDLTINEIKDSLYKNNEDINHNVNKLEKMLSLWKEELHLNEISQSQYNQLLI